MINEDSPTFAERLVGFLPIRVISAILLLLNILALVLMLICLGGVFLLPPPKTPVALSFMAGVSIKAACSIGGTRLIYEGLTTRDSTLFLYVNLKFLTRFGKAGYLVARLGACALGLFLIFLFP